LSLQSQVDKVRSPGNLVVQMLLNLVTNGLKYNSKAKREIAIEVTKSAGSYIFTVKDNGDGMKEGEIDSAFELFENNDRTDRSGKKGTGIGLPMVRKLVDRLGGKLNISSRVGEGTTVHFSLPTTYQNS